MRNIDEHRCEEVLFGIGRVLERDSFLVDVGFGGDRLLCGIG